MVVRSRQFQCLPSVTFGTITSSLKLLLCSCSSPANSRQQVQHLRRLRRIQSLPRYCALAFVSPYDGDERPHAGLPARNPLSRPNAPARLDRDIPWSSDLRASRFRAHLRPSRIISATRRPRAARSAVSDLLCPHRRADHDGAADSRHQGYSGHGAGGARFGAHGVEEKEAVGEGRWRRRGRGHCTSDGWRNGCCFAVKGGGGGQPATKVRPALPRKERMLTTGAK